MISIRKVVIDLVVAFCFSCYVVSAQEQTPTAPYFINVPAEDRVVYDAWWTGRGSQLYPKKVFLPMVTEPTNGAAVYWRFTSTLTAVGRDGSVGVGDVSESEATHIQFAIAVRAEGWVGLGISEAGKMEEAGGWNY